MPATLPAIDRDGQLGRIRQESRKLLSQAYLAGIGLPEMISILTDANREITLGTPASETACPTQDQLPECGQRREEEDK